MFESDIADLVIRTMADIISVTIGVYIYEKVHFLMIFGSQQIVSIQKMQIVNINVKFYAAQDKEELN